MPADFSTANIGVSTKRDVSASLFSDGIFSVGFLEHVLRFSRVRGFGTRRGLKYSRNFFRSVVRSIEEFEMVRGEETILLLLENFQSFFVANFEFEWEVCEKFRRLADASH